MHFRASISGLVWWKYGHVTLQFGRNETFVIHLLECTGSNVFISWRVTCFGHELFRVTSKHTIDHRWTRQIARQAIRSRVMDKPVVSPARIPLPAQEEYEYRYVLDRS